jgi:hypothetical protein
VIAVTWQVSPDVVWLQADDGVRLYDAAEGEFQTLNPTAAGIWLRVAGGEDTEEIVAALAEEYHAEDDAQRRLIAADVHEFLTDLGAKGLLVGAHAGRG